MILPVVTLAFYASGIVARRDSLPRQCGGRGHWPGLHMDRHAKGIRSSAVILAVTVCGTR